MAEKGDFLIGNIALREGLISKEQLYDCLIAQEHNPAKSLGSLMVSRGYLKNEDVDRLLELQRNAIESAAEGATDSPRAALLGKILIERGLATEYQVNECLRLQGRLRELGIKPIAPLGEIMINRGYLKKDAVAAALQLQDLSLYACPECGADIGTEQKKEGSEDYVCPKCGSEVPALLAKMAAAAHEALETGLRRHDQDLPDEVRLAGLDPAKHFGKYVLLNEIGRGGAGIVYRAWQRDLNKLVALKLLPHESDTAAGVRTPYGDAEDIKRFYNEGRAVADLSHPNIVPILDFGSADSHFFYTMKYIDGVTIDSIVRDGIDRSFFAGLEPGEPRTLKGGDFPCRLAASIIRDVCRAVEYAHGRGIYHRDIKPSNVIIDRKGRPWVMDFGLAKVSRIGDSAYVKGVIMGTPYYMPPEQAIGDMEKVDDLSDVYSLGAVLYELLSGHCPYSGKSPDEVLALLPKSPPDPVEKLAPRLEEGIVRIVRKAMQHDRARRYRKASAMADDLQRFINGEPLVPEPDGAGVLPFWTRVRKLLTGQTSVFAA